jgi:DNA polymerase-3 subunit epsilon
MSTGCVASSSIDGKRITRDLAMGIVEDAGLQVAPRVTKKLDVLVVADPDTASGKAKKAREYSVRIIAERSFWQKLGVAVD